MRKFVLAISFTFALFYGCSAFQSETMKEDPDISQDAVRQEPAIEKSAREKAASKIESGWPTTVDAAVIDIISGMSKKNRETIRNTSRSGLIRFHHGWGTGIRNSFGLWRGNYELMKSACGGKMCDPDRASMVIIEAVWETLQVPGT